MHQTSSINKILTYLMFIVITSYRTHLEAYTHTIFNSSNEPIHVRLRYHGEVGRSCARDDKYNVLPGKSWKPSSGACQVRTISIRPAPTGEDLRLIATRNMSFKDMIKDAKKGGFEQRKMAFERQDKKSTLASAKVKNASSTEFGKALKAIAVVGNSIAAIESDSAIGTVGHAYLAHSAASTSAPTYNELVAYGSTSWNYKGNGVLVPTKGVKAYTN